MSVEDAADPVRFSELRGALPSTNGEEITDYASRSAPEMTKARSSPEGDLVSRTCAGTSGI